MTDRCDRRALLRAGIGVGVAGLSGCLRLSGGNPTVTETQTAPGTTTETTPRDSDGDGVPDDEDYAPRDPDVQEESDLEETDSPTDSPTDTESPTDSPTPTESPTQTPFPDFEDSFEGGTGAWALDPLASEGTAISLVESGGFESDRALRWDFSSGNTTAYAVTADPQLSPTQSVAAVAKVPDLSNRSITVSLSNPAAFDPDEDGELELIQFSYSGWGGTLNATPNNTDERLLETDASDVFAAGEWVEIVVEWPSVSTVAVSARNLTTGAETERVTAQQSALSEGPKEIGLAVYNASGGSTSEGAFFDRVLVD
jgi:hypothetical protein